MTTLRAWTTLVLLAFRRQLWSTSTLMLSFPLAACGLFLVRRRFHLSASPVEAFQAFSYFLLIVFTAFLVPLCALTYGTASLAGDREDRTLLFLLVRPLGRGLILSAKFVATLPLVLGVTCGSFAVYCRLAGAAGAAAYDAYLPAVVCMSLCYTALFHLFAVLFRYAATAALIYAVFMEILLGNLPGIIKRAAVNFYGRSMMFEAGVEHGLATPDPDWFEPLSATDGRNVLLGLTATALAAAWLIFRGREYRDVE